MYVFNIEAGGMVGETPQKYISCLFVAAPQNLQLDFKWSKSKTH